ncbi:MAG: helix-turn-helix transcriptional regulator [Oribacterium sp.]|nr:helix-turn-helix transcriptional regulator [Oribacterium sp.]
MEESIGSRLQKLRHLMEYRQEDVASMLGVERHALSQYETGVRMPPPDIITRLAGIYGVSTDYILGIGGGSGSDDRFIDVTGLSQREIMAVTALVNVMREKNDGTENKDK